MLTEAKVGVAVSDSRRREQMGAQEATSNFRNFKELVALFGTPAKCLSPRPTFWGSILFTRWWSWGRGYYM